MKLYFSGGKGFSLIGVIVSMIAISIIAAAGLPVFIYQIKGIRFIYSLTPACICRFYLNKSKSKGVRYIYFPNRNNYLSIYLYYTILCLCAKKYPVVEARSLISEGEIVYLRYTSRRLAIFKTRTHKLLS